MASVAPRPNRPAPQPQGPITIAGYFRAPSGLGEGARRLADMLEQAGARVYRADLTAALRQGPAGPPPDALSGCALTVKADAGGRTDSIGADDNGEAKAGWNASKDCASVCEETANTLATSAAAQKIERANARMDERMG
jgi:hypothetical protein